MQLDYSSVN